MVYFGIDMSYNSPGITVIDGDKVFCYFVANKVKHRDLKCDILNVQLNVLEDPKQENFLRIANIGVMAELVLDIFGVHNTDGAAICIEHYAYGAGSSSESTLYELGGILRYLLMKSGISLPAPHMIEAAPQTLKKFFTGNGNATKYNMVCQFCEETGIDWFNVFKFKRSQGDLSPLSDVADSYAAARYAAGTKPEGHVKIVDAILKS